MTFKQQHTRLTRLTRLMAMAGGLGILCIAIVVTVDVFLRKLAGTTLGGATEIAGMVFAIATALAYPFMLLDRASIRIDVLYARLKVPARAVLDLVAMLVMLYFLARLTQSAFELFSKSWQLHTMNNGVLQIPLWMPQGLWVLGLMLFTLTALFLVVYALAGIARKRWADVTRAAGVPSIEEETHSSIADVAAHTQGGAR